MINCTRHLNVRSSICASKSGLELFENDDFSDDSESAYSSGTECLGETPHFYCGDDEDSDEEELCPECHQRRNTALVDTLPGPVVTGMIVIWINVCLLLH